MNAITPMLSKTGSKKDLVNKDYLYEPKLDGVRVMLHKEGNEIRLINRRKRDVSLKYPELLLPDSLKARDCIIDGEIIVYDDKGNPDFHLLMRREQLSNPLAIERMVKQMPVRYIAFDIYAKDGKDLHHKPLLERKELLKKTIVENDLIQTMHYTPQGLALWDFVMDRHLEGVVAKRMDSAYRPGARSDDWLKIKNFKTQDCIIIGYTQDQRLVSSLALAAHDKGKLRFIGKVGTGFSEALINELHEEFKALQRDTPAVEPPAHYKNIIWLEPEMVCEVRYIDFGSDGMLRSPSFQRLRPDKPPVQCIIEMPERFAVKERNGQPVAHWRHRAWRVSKEMLNEKRGNK